MLSTDRHVHDIGVLKWLGTMFIMVAMRLKRLLDCSQKGCIAGPRVQVSEVQKACCQSEQCRCSQQRAWQHSFQTQVGH